MLMLRSMAWRSSDTQSPLVQSRQGVSMREARTQTGGDGFEQWGLLRVKEKTAASPSAMREMTHMVSFLEASFQLPFWGCPMLPCCNLVEVAPERARKPVLVVVPSRLEMVMSVWGVRGMLARRVTLMTLAVYGYMVDCSTSLCRNMGACTLSAARSPGTKAQMASPEHGSPGGLMVATLPGRVISLSRSVALMGTPRDSIMMAGEFWATTGLVTTKEK
mmetsp:Transcript_6046/g.14464  ORF Transcript_6046/g.14464 Transcript_6046/m.14464 type:complete len:219 (-) Transcript_6046:3011-3667(-)